MSIMQHRDSRINFLLKLDTLILQLGCILNTVPAWKKAYTLRVAVFVEYESDVEEERGRVKALLQNLRIEAEILVFCLASGDLPTYEVIVNGQSPGLDAEREVDDCLKNQDWWEEIQKIRGNRGEATASEDLAEVASVLNATTTWPEASFQQGPRHARVERFVGLRKLLKRSRRRHTMSGITRLGVSLGMRTQRLDPQLMKGHPSNASASEDSGSSEESSDTDVFETDSDDNESHGRQSVASEGDIDEFDSDNSHRLSSPTKITRRRSHGDSMRCPPPSKKSTGERKPKVPEPTKNYLTELPSVKVCPPDGDVAAGTEEQDARPRTSDTVSSKAASISNMSNELAALRSSSDWSNEDEPPALPVTPKMLEDRFSALQNRPPPTPTPQRPAMSRHSSMPKFSSKPVPMTKVATEDGPGPSIMFTDTPSPPPRRNRLPSAYRTRDGGTELSDHISEVSEDEQNHSQLPSLSRHGSAYSTQSLPLSFNDLPCRAQHLILNELMKQHSTDTAVMFTTLPSPLEGTSKSEETSISYLSDLEVLCKGCPPCLLVHSNSMTVTMSL
jgi:solute carrier family 12 (potassium/chloride transporters), member 9